MAIYNAVPPPPEYTNINDATGTTPPPQAPPQSTSTPVANGAIDIDAWTVSALQALSVSPVARGTGTPLAIPIDDAAPVKRPAVTFTDNAEDPIKRPRSRRDSQKTRESVLKGKEGSRQRRRWENDHLMHVPNVQPPLPSDWEVHPTHPTHRVPYQLAQFWDRGARQRAEDKVAQLAATRKKQQLKKGTATGLREGEVPRDLRETAKRSPAVKSWVRVLEEPVRQFLHSSSASSEDFTDEEGVDSEDEEIVFVGREGAMRDLREKKNDGWKMAHREVEQRTVDEGMVFDSFGDDESAAFKRWLTHSISDYYGLESRSVTLMNPSRRVVYVGLKKAHKMMEPVKHFPRPLWELC